MLRPTFIITFMSNQTNQLFSTQSDAYRANRPTYDPQLFAWLADIAPDTGSAWDCGCGSGQASIDLAQHFRQVIATDVNPAQLAQAPAAPNIDYRCEPSEATSLEDCSIDLTVVAQALHWFDLDRFYAEVRRVSKPGALLAVISYNLLQVDPAIDALVHTLYHDVLGPYWAAERKHVESGYRTLAFPFEAIGEPPATTLTADWTLGRFLGYLESWSALATYKEANGVNPLVEFKPRFERGWGDPDQLKTMRWPLTIRVGIVDTPKSS